MKTDSTCLCLEVPLWPPVTAEVSSIPLPKYWAFLLPVIRLGWCKDFVCRKMFNNNDRAFMMILPHRYEVVIVTVIKTLLELSTLPSLSWHTYKKTPCNVAMEIRRNPITKIVHLSEDESWQKIFPNVKIGENLVYRTGLLSMIR